MRVTITNNESAGGKVLMAQTFFVAEDGTPDQTPFDARAIFPGISAILHIGESNALVLQQAPQAAASREGVA